MEQAIIEKSKLVEIDLELKSREDEINEFRSCYAMQRANMEEATAYNSIACLEQDIKHTKDRNIIEKRKSRYQYAEGVKARKEMLHLIKKTAKNVTKEKEENEIIENIENQRRFEDVKKLKNELKENREEIAANHRQKTAILAKLAAKEKIKQEKMESEAPKDIFRTTGLPLQMTDGQLKREAYIRRQLQNQYLEEQEDKRKLPRNKNEKIKTENRKMTINDDSVMDIMNYNGEIYRDAAADLANTIRTKAKGKKWRTSASNNKKQPAKQEASIKHEGVKLLLKSKKLRNIQTKAEKLRKKKQNYKIHQESS